MFWVTPFSCLLFMRFFPFSFENTKKTKKCAKNTQKTFQAIQSKFKSFLYELTWERRGWTTLSCHEILGESKRWIVLMLKVFRNSWKNSILESISEFVLKVAKSSKNLICKKFNNLTIKLQIKFLVINLFFFHSHKILSFNFSSLNFNKNNLFNHYDRQCQYLVNIKLSYRDFIFSLEKSPESQFWYSQFIFDYIKTPFIH